MKQIPLGRPSTNQEEIKNVTKVLKSGWLTHGEFNLKLEIQLKTYFKVKHACLLNSCASALLVGLLALDLPKNGEVILPSFTFTASANAIVLAGLKPVFAEIDYQTGNLDPQKLESFITKKTVALMPVHFAGLCCDMSAIIKLAKKHQLKVIEDSAECIGGKWQNKFAGTFGDLGCFSFWATKNLTTGEGGAVITNSAKLADKIKTLSAHGIPSSTLQREKLQKPWLRNASQAGYNFRLSNLQAAVGVAQMKKLKVFNQKRRKLAQRLTTKLAKLPQIITPYENKKAFHIYQMYPIKLIGVDRTQFIKKLQKNGIQASVHFDPPVHQQSFYQKFTSRPLPVTDKLSQTEVTLPLYPSLTFNDIDYLVKIIKKAV